MDISELYTVDACNEGAELQIVSPVTGKETDCYITVAGIDSKAFREAERNLKRKLVKGDASIDDVTAEALASSVISWQGFESDGKEWKFNKKNAIALFKNSPAIANQVDRFIADRANFIKG